MRLLKSVSRKERGSVDAMLMQHVSVGVSLYFIVVTIK